MKYRVKRIIKKVLRLILFFAVLGCLSFSCFAQEYSNFTSFALGSIVSWNTYNEYGQTLLSASYPANSGPRDYINLDFYGDDVIYGFDIKYGGGNVKQKYEKNDILYLEHSLFIEYLQANPNDPSLNPDQIQDWSIVISEDVDDEGNYQYVTVKGENAFRNPEYVEMIDSDGNIYIGYRVDVLVSVPLTFANSQSQVVELQYNFKHIGAAYGAMRVSFAPSSWSGLYYYVGSKDNAPIYPEFRDPSLDDSIDKEDQILGSLDFDEIGSSVSTAAGAFTRTRTPALAVSNIFNNILSSQQWLNDLLYTALIFGLFGTMFGITSSLIRKAREK